jgi:hypothetical protein
LFDVPLRRKPNETYIHHGSVRDRVRMRVRAEHIQSSLRCCDYSKWQLVIYSSAASGSSTVQVSYPGATLNTGSQTACTFTAVNGRTFSPIAVGVPITINDSSSETVTPTAVTNTPTGCSFTASLASAHAANVILSSGTYGLQEAIQDAFAMGGGTVVVNPFWSASGGSDALLSAALPYTGVSIEDDRKGSPQYWNSLPSTTSLLAAPTTLTSQAACDATHQFCSDAAVVGSASWGGTVHGCITWSTSMETNLHALLMPALRR